MVPEITAMLHVAQEQGLAMVRGLEMLTKQIEILADFVEMANKSSGQEFGPKVWRRIAKAELDVSPQPVLPCPHHGERTDTAAHRAVA